MAVQGRGGRSSGARVFMVECSLCKGGREGCTLLGLHVAPH